MENKRPLLAGPWIGEFGWELFNFQGFVRALMASGEFSELIVCTRPGNQYLYHDILENHGGKFDTYEFPYDTINSWKNDDVNLDVFMSQAYPDLLGKIYWFKPDNYMRGYRNMTPIFVQPKPDEEGPICDIILHVRTAYHCNSGFRNWEKEHAIKVAYLLMQRGYTVASVGLSRTATYIEDTVNLMDIPLDVLATVMARAKVFVGPLSGPAHYATLCRLPQVTWVTHIHHEIRVRQTWNPFSVPVTVFRSPSNDLWRKRQPFTPSITELVDATIAAMKREFK